MSTHGLPPSNDPQVDPHAAPPAGPVAAEPRGSLSTLVLLVLGVFAYLTMEMMVAPIVPFVQQELGITASQSAWMLTGLLVVGAVCLPLATRYADIADKKKVFLVVLGLSGVGAITAAVATTAPLLIAGQMLQGVGVAVVPIAIGIMRDSQPLDRARTANTIFVVSGGVGAAVAYVAVGPIVTHLHYSFIYWLPTIVIAAVVLVGVRVLPSCPPVTGGTVDWAGAVVLGAALVSLLLGLTFPTTLGWGSPLVLGLLVLTIALLAVFVVVERRHSSPLVDLRGLAEREILGVLGINVAHAITNFVMYVILPTVALLPIALGYGMGGDASTAGLVLLPYALLVIVAGPTAQRLEPIVGRRGNMMLSAVFIIAAGLVLLPIGSTPWTPYLCSALMGLGLGIGFTQSLNTVVRVVPAERVASASGAVYVVRSVGGVLGGQIAAAIISAGLTEQGAPSWGAILANILIIVALGVATIALSFLLAGRRATVLAAAPLTPAQA
ncbi:MFS transporter [Pseudonocardia sp. NPDC049154]|uniref:MFS transporter n=1 Tax=Pseudonocardia sp. NPDC049154 TaxID=3155501 RepID=UPI0033F7B565